MTFPKGSMPSKAKLDALGVDVNPETLPSWPNPDMFDPFILPVIDALLRAIAFEAMWRAAQDLSNGPWKE